LRANFIYLKVLCLGKVSEWRYAAQIQNHPIGLQKHKNTDASYGGNTRSTSSCFFALKGSRMKSEAIPIWIDKFAM
jgi:hypothetical protein